MIPNIAGISSGNNNTEDEFFLTKENFPELYHHDQVRYEHNKEKIKEPAVQLSAKGLALMSFLYAQKDKSDKQPLVADSVKSLDHITRLMDKSPPGTNVTVIFQATDKEGEKSAFWSILSEFHKTVIKFERTNEGMRVIIMDGSTSDIVFQAIAEQSAATISEHAKKSEIPTKLDVFVAVPNYDLKVQYRQKSLYECGIFATKDAREMNRDDNFYDHHLRQSEILTDVIRKFPGEVNTYRYKIPTIFLKSSQSSQDQVKHLDAGVGDVIVTGKGKTLQETFNKHNVSYANHFANKYNKQVKAFVNSKTPEEIGEAVAKYDASKMTLDRLIATYGPTSSKKTQVKQTESLQQQKRPAAITPQVVTANQSVPLGSPKTEVKTALPTQDPKTDKLNELLNSTDIAWLYKQRGATKKHKVKKVLQTVNLAIGNVHKSKRNKQINSLNNLILSITKGNDKTLSVDEKLAKLNQALQKIKDEIKGEKNTFDSRLSAICDDLQHKLEAIKAEKSHKPNS